MRHHGLAHAARRDRDTPLMLDTARIRADFPLLDQTENGRPLVYIDNAATTQKPRQVLAALEDYYRTSNANVHRGAYTLAVKATDAYEAARAAVARFLDAPVEGVVFTRGTTEAINLVAGSYGRANVGPGDTVVVTAMDHHSNLVPWQLLCQDRGATLRMVEVTADGRIDLGDFAEAVAVHPKVVAFPYVSNALGTINPAAELIRMAHAAGAVTVVDGAQSTPHLPVSVRTLDCDFYAFSGHKMLGPMGSGALVAKPALLEAMPPYHGGGEMIARVYDDHSTWNSIPHKFEAGTPNVEGAVGLAAAIGYLERLGMAKVAEHEAALGRIARERLSTIDGVKLYGPPTDRAGVVSFTYGDIHPHDLATALDHEGVCVRAGHHCTQPLMRRLGVTATCRASFYLYNSPDDVEALAGALTKAGALFGPVTA
jgi:cysteine desulfurase / selenocysteine lyase